MKNIQASIEFITPVHIGNGETVGPIEYFIRDNVFHRLNFSKYISSLDSNKKSEYIHAMDTDDHIKLRTFPKANSKNEAISIKIPVSSSIQREYNQKVSAVNNTLDINLFPFDPIRKIAYIPGSSLKGALRTAVINHLINQKKSRDIQEIINNKYKLKEFESILLNYRNRNDNGQDIRKDFFRSIKIPDIPLSENYTKIVDCLNFHRFRNNFDSFDQRMEVTLSRISSPNTPKIFPFEFQWNEQLIQKANFQIKFNLQNLGSWANEHYLPILRWEIETFSSLKNSPYYNTLKNLKLESNQFLIRLGRFGHVESKTVEIYRNPKANKGWGRTRTLAESNYPMGWAIITIEGASFTQPQYDPNWKPSGEGKSDDSRSPTQNRTNQERNPSNRNQPQVRSDVRNRENQRTENQSGFSKKPSNEREGNQKNYHSSSTFNPFKNLKQNNK